MNFIFCELKNLKKHGFHFLQAHKDLKKHEFHFFATFKKFKKHAFHFCKLKKTQKI